ncbi:uncharacterized protein [Coffea arabica]|uniref:Reverse transcriptase domain-containing protein n=1 Tax=Coffea arabica TaxID=13443 RepID=A0A6P6SJE2_COFAR|nr:uncharacterized protein LOC113691843 [Coffea arabica]
MECLVDENWTINVVWDFSKFRPISLCNFFSKLLSRILVGQLGSVIPRIILPQQTGFVKGRNITDNYLLAQELISTIGKKARGGNVALKLDMTKAYDRMSWRHIITMLRAFGFGERFIDLVWRLISNMWFSIVANGTSHGFFKSTRGLWQGDPLSPVLVIIGSEMLSRGLNSLALQQNFVGFRVPMGYPVVTHLAFANDVLIFTNGSTTALKQIMQVLEAYQLSSGQLVNVQKSGFLVHPTLSPARKRVIERITQFTRQELPIRYLGLPLYLGRSKSAYFVETGKSLWTQFMQAKYYRDLHPCQVELRRFDSSTWRRMLNISRQVELAMLWVVNAGSCNFWYDNWLGSEALCLKSIVNPTHSFKDFLTNGEWNGAMLRQYIPQEIIALILEHPVPSGDRHDELVWSQTASGKFTLASVFQEVRQAQNYSVLHSQVWHPRIPLKVSFFMMRLLLGKLPLTDVLRRIGVQLVSKCLCCQGGAIETLEHVFAEGQVAKDVWRYFGRICGVTQLGSLLRAWLTAWWLFSPRQAVRQFLFSILPSFICWHTWKARNIAYYEGRQMSVAKICHAILLDVIGVVEIQFNQKLEVHTFLQLYEWTTQQTSRYSFHLVWWKAKEAGLLTLNTDGCSKGNPGVSGGGGILRDSSGLPLFAFSTYFGEISSLRAEALALVMGSICAFKRGLSIEANRVADSLAKVGASRHNRNVTIYDDFNAIPRQTRGEIRINRYRRWCSRTSCLALHQLGFPNFHRVTM